MVLSFGETHHQPVDDPPTPRERFEVIEIGPRHLGREIIAQSRTHQPGLGQLWRDHLARLDTAQVRVDVPAGMAHQIEDLQPRCMLRVCDYLGQHRLAPHRFHRHQIRWPRQIRHRPAIAFASEGFRRQRHPVDQPFAQRMGGGRAIGLGHDRTRAHGAQRTAPEHCIEIGSDDVGRWRFLRVARLGHGQLRLVAAEGPGMVVEDLQHPGRAGATEPVNPEPVRAVCAHVAVSGFRQMKTASSKRP